MRPLARVLLVLAAFVAFQGVQACASETPDPGLNPQPLPPEDKKDDTARTGEEAAQDPNTGVGGGSTSSGSSGGSSSGGSSGAVPADGDAGDGGGDN